MRLGGIMYFKVNGVQHSASGNFTFNTGQNKREAKVTNDGVPGYISRKQAAYIDGMIVNTPDLDLIAFVNLRSETITLELANGKTMVMPNAFYTADGDGTSEEAEVQVRFEAESMQEIKP